LDEEEVSQLDKDFLHIYLQILHQLKVINIFIYINSIKIDLPIHEINESNISRANKGSFNSRKYNLITPATEFISRPVTLINGSSPFSKASLN
jgi:hypothetical protein